MGTMKRCAALALTISLHATVYAAEPANSAALVSQVAARMSKASGIRAQFTQTQTLAAMKQPLVSTGSIVFIRERGVLWHIESPYKTTYVITDSSVTEVDANGRRVPSSSGNGARGVAQVSKMMRAMLGGDLSQLYSQFAVEAGGTPEKWHVTLTPSQPQIAQSIKGLQMDGSDFLQTLRITLANGDTTVLGFTHSAMLSELTPAERALFGAS
jgi:outer membrane lipoprotein-sorting protein